MHRPDRSIALVAVCCATAVLGVSSAVAQCPPIPMPETPPAFLHSWGIRGTADDQFRTPYGIAVDSFGDVWVVDTWNHEVKKFQPDGTWLATFGGPGSGDTHLNTPAQLAFDADGNWYVTHRHEVKMFDAAGNFIRAWGELGTGDGQFGIPDGIGVGPNGNVYVVDHDNSRVQKFTAEGVYITQWTHANMFHPHGLAITDDDHIYISGGGTSRVLKFDLDGNHVLTFGLFKKVVDCAEGGEFWHTVGLGLDSSGNLYVSDSFNFRIQKFSSTESFLMLWGAEGAGDEQFADPGPGHVAIADDGTIYVADSGNDRVQAFNGNVTSAVDPVFSSWGRLKSGFRGPSVIEP